MDAYVRSVRREQTVVKITDAHAAGAVLKPAGKCLGRQFFQCLLSSTFNRSLRCIS